MKTDLTQLDPMQRAIVLSIKRHAPEPLNDKPGIHTDVLIGWLCCAAVTWGGIYLLAQVIRWALSRWL